jgi:hypothetical protein
MQALLSAPQNEKRHTELLMYLWHRLRGERLFPSEDAIDFDELTDVWEHCFLVQVRDIVHVEHYNYTYLGEGIINDYASGALPEGVPDLVTLDAGDIGHLLARVVMQREPHITTGTFPLLDGKEIRFRQCLLPLGPSDDAVHSVLGRISYKITFA